MSGILSWASPLLRGARLLGVFDTTGGGALARLDVAGHGHVNIVTDHIEGETGAVEGETGLGTVEEVREDGERVTLIGDFGWVEFAANAQIDIVDHWTGDVDGTRSLIGHPVPEQQLIGTVLVRPDVQIRISRRETGTAPRDTILSCRDTIGVQTEGESAVIFASDDLTMRTIELANLLGHTTTMGEVPAPDVPVGALVVVQIVHGADADGIFRGGEYRWVECGRDGWVQVIEGDTRRPTPVSAVAADLVATIVGTEAEA
jgi:hypothetical protein